MIDEKMQANKHTDRQTKYRFKAPCQSLNKNNCWTAYLGEPCLHKIPKKNNWFQTCFVQKRWFYTSR